MDNTLANAGGFFSGTNFFPNDLWATLFQHLTLDEVICTTSITTNMLEAGKSDVIFQTVLSHFLNNLNILGANIPTNHITKENILSHIKKGFQQVHAQQDKEADYLIKHHPELLAVLSHKKKPTQSISQLQARSQQLDKINSQIIFKQIHTSIKIMDKKKLNLCRLGLTRFPESLLQDERLIKINYWERLTELRCGTNQITALPPLNACINLKTLNVSLNCLTTLPLLNACVNLEILSCDYNQLTTLSQDLLDKGFTLGIQHPPTLLSPIPALTMAFHHNQRQNQNKRKLNEATLNDIEYYDSETDAPNTKKQKTHNTDGKYKI